MILAAQSSLVTSEHAGVFFIHWLRLFGGFHVLAHLLEPLHGTFSCLLGDVGVVNGGFEASCNAGWLFGVFCSPNLCKRTAS